MKWLNLDSKKPLRYAKEAIYAGQFTKGDQAFEVTEPMLRRLADSVTELTDAGIDVPFTLGHDRWMESDARLGTVVNAVVDKNEEGIPNLVLGIDFNDEKARDIAINADVSIGYLSEFKDCKGVVRRSLLRHCASTSAPVISGLDDWYSLCCSFSKDTSMSTLLETLGVDSEEAAIEAVKKLQEAAKPAEKIELSYPEIVIKTLRDGRIAQLEAEVRQGEISPAVRDELVLAFANEKELALELSHQSSDSFELAMKIAKLASRSQPLAPTGRTSKPGENEVTLSHDTVAPCPLDAIIEEMAAKAKK